jgi:hypothetical protein
MSIRSEFFVLSVSCFRQKLCHAKKTASLSKRIIKDVACLFVIADWMHLGRASGI